MTPAELAACRLVAVYGYGREGRALVRHVRATTPDADLLVLLDDQPDGDTRADAARLGFDLVTGPDAVVEVVSRLEVDVVLRSPGVPLRSSGLPASPCARPVSLPHGRPDDA